MREQLGRLGWAAWEEKSESEIVKELGWDKRRKGE
jgi:hypothetical protein